MLVAEALEVLLLSAYFMPSNFLDLLKKYSNSLLFT